MSKIDNLGYEQLIALRTMRDTPDIEGSEICKKADCSFAELFSMAQIGLIEIGEERIKPKTLHPILTDAGILALAEAEERAII